MAKYINVDKINIVYKMGEFYYDDKVKNVPQIEARPVRHGKWNYSGGQFKNCSRCNGYVELKTSGVQYWKFCPHCGALMDLK